MSKTWDSARFQSAYEIKKANFAIFFYNFEAKCACRKQNKHI